MQELTGGRDGVIFRLGDTVKRPLNPWSASVHKLLNAFEEQGIEGVPRVVGVEQGFEHLSFIKGDTYNYPLLGNVASSQALQSAASLLRVIHDASVPLASELKSCDWMLKVREPCEVICHGDFAPYNVALKGRQVVGVFDFDTAHPAPRVWDLAYSIYCWAPFKTDANDRLGNLDEQIERAKVFCDSYGANVQQRQALPETMVTRLQSLVDFMQTSARKGNTQFKQNIKDGHHLSYLEDIEYIRQSSSFIRKGLVA